MVFDGAEEYGPVFVWAGENAPTRSFGKKFPHELVAGSGEGFIGPAGIGIGGLIGQPPCSWPSCLSWSHFPQAGLVEHESTQRCLGTILHS